jgi:hypothetical protein
MAFTTEEEFVLPLRAVACPYCAEWVAGAEGMSLMETLWLHEYECPGIAKDFELAA